MCFKLKQFFAKKRLNRLNKKINLKEQIWNIEKNLISVENTIDLEKKELSDVRKKTKRPSWSKVLLTFLFINFTLLEGFIAWVTIKSFAVAQATTTTPDFLPLVTLIGAVIGETISYGIYSAKSKAENTEGGIVYETAMHALCNDDSNAEEQE